MNSPEHSEIPENTYEIQLTPCKSLSKKSRTSINLFDFAVEGNEEFVHLCRLLTFICLFQSFQGRKRRKQSK